MRPVCNVALMILAVTAYAFVASAAVSPNSTLPPTITSLTSPIMVGDSFVITGTGFVSGSVVNLFVSTSGGAVNQGPLVPSAISSNMLVVPVPVAVTQGDGVATVQVVNTDGHGNPINQPSNVVTALLQGSSAHALPSITSINGVGLAADSTNAGIATANVETVVIPGKTVIIGGSGFDTVNGVAVNLFCTSPAGKVGPFFLKPGDPGLSATSISIALPSSGADAPAFGPGSFVVINKGADGSYSRASAAVSFVIGEQVTITSVSEQGHIITVTGTGFSNATAINFFNQQNGSVFNLGGSADIPLNVISPGQFKFVVPPGVMTGPAYVQAINPPFTPFTSSGDGPNQGLSVNAPPVFAYVEGDTGVDVIQAVSVSQSALTPGKLGLVGSYIFAAPFAGIGGMLVDPTNNYLYVTDQVDNTVSAFAILQSGPNQGAPIPDGLPVSAGSKPGRMAAHPNGHFLYVANTGDGTISAFSIMQSGANAGQLLPNGPAVPSGSIPLYLTVDPTGRYLYVTNNDDSTVSAFKIVQSGVAAGQLIKNGATVSVTAPQGIAVDPSGRYAYVASLLPITTGSQLFAFNIVQSGTTAGQLVHNGPGFTIFGTPLDVLVDPMGLNVIVSSFGCCTIGVLAITQNGPTAGQVSVATVRGNGGGSPTSAPFVLGGGNVGFNDSGGVEEVRGIADFWIAGGSQPSFVFEQLDTFPFFTSPLTGVGAATN
jgi:DNA-binding beta-propeller fold protein YncE